MFFFVLGTKAELIKTAPLMKEFNKNKLEYCFVHTGHHKIDELCEQFKIPLPDISLFKAPKTSSRFFLKTKKAIKWGILLSYKLKKLFSNCGKKDLVIVHGDTITTGVTSFVARTSGLKVAHIEAGLRSHDFFEPFPEEFMRVVADHFSVYLFAVSKTAADNLRQEGIKGKVFLTGNTIADSVKMSLKMGRKSEWKNHVIVNIHRNENLQSKSRMKRIVEIIKNISLEIHWPIHDNTKYALKKYGLWDELKKQKNITFSPLMSYFDFLNEMKRSKFIVTDGGSIQEESLYLRKPCMIMRMKTERVEGLKTGINFLTKLNLEYSKKVIEMLEGGFKIPKFTNPYGEPGVSEKIVKIIEALT